MALATRGAGPLNLLGRNVSILKNYTVTPSYASVYPTYVRLLVLTEFTTIQYAVTNLRTLSPSWSMRMNTQCCWVDFNQTFEVAHTAGRQRRCELRYKANGAVYYEAILRNQVWTKWITTWGNYFSIALELGLRESLAGRRWLATTAAALNSTTASQEMAYWNDSGIAYFQLQWLNRWSTGISESMTIENALGWKQQYTTKNIPRMTGPWTTLILFWLPYNDLWVLNIMNRSAIRGTSNYYAANNSAPAINLEAWSGFVMPTPGCSLLSSAIGPMPSVDTYYIAPPPALISLYEHFRSVLADAVHEVVSVAQVVAAFPSMVLSPTPASWSRPNMLYYGGNPTCITGAGLPFVQQTFSFSDACGSQKPLQFTLSSASTLFALYVTGIDANLPCALQTSSLCIAALGDAAAIVSNLTPAPPLVTATAQVQSTGVGIMQFASENGTLKLLWQPLLDGGGWDFYGWMSLYEWVEGAREVVSFEGDVATLPLMSDVYTGDMFSTSGGSQKVEHATEGILYVVVYTSVVLAGVALLCSACAISIDLRVRSANLWRFNRVVGAVWIGRPLLFVRGCTALLLLSTAPTELVQVNGHTSFAPAPRSLVASAIIAGEATWVMYVVNDAMVVIATRLTRLYAPLSCAITWAAFLLVERTTPLQLSATLDRQCNAHDMDFQLNCASGTVQIGSLNRLLLLTIIQSVAFVASMGIVVGADAVRRRRATSPATGSAANECGLPQTPLLISGTANSFIEANVCNELWCVDKVSSIMCGLLPFSRRSRSQTFDLKLWVIMEDTQPDAIEKRYPPPLLRLNSSRPPLASEPSTLAAPAVRWDIRGYHVEGHRVIALCGFIFVVLSIISSVSYLTVVQVNLANDMSWATFNMTGAQAFVANWINEQLVLGADNWTFRLDNASVVQVAQFSSPTASVASPANFGALMQYTQLNEIHQTVAAFRSMDACAMPWVFSQYCYVDFQRRWSVANSAQRQARCTAMIGNGAVYLESFLRNVEWTDLSQCWGSSFAIAIGDELQTTQAGRAWLAQIQGPMVSVADEVAHWTASGITEYTTQWQNYKKIGLINSYAIENALGVAYDFTLQYLNGSFQFAQQSTFKMYWALGSDWELVARNSSAIGGMSLVRGSSNFAFANQTLESVMVTNGTLSLPFNNIFASVRAYLGPFGSVDMFYIVPPEEALRGFRMVQAAMRSALAGSLMAQQDFFLIEPIDAVRPVPKAWLALNTNAFGGSLLCSQPGASGDQRLLAGLINLASYSIACSTNGIYSQVQPNREYIVLSALLSGVATSPRASVNLPDICSQDTGHLDHCLSYLTQSFAFVDAHIVDVETIAATSLAVMHAIRALNIEFVQFVGDNATAPMTVLHINVLEPSDPTFFFFGWWYLCDWVFGTREVISFQGDGARINVLSEYLAPFSQDVLPWQFPTTLANYARSGAIYVTIVMISVSALVFVYIVLSRGYVEGFNMLELSRVGAIVWVGRPLLFLRSMTAIAVLSSASLELQLVDGAVSLFSSLTPPWYKTWLASSEVTWLVAVVNDIGLLATHGYAYYYATPNSILVWGLCSLLSRAYPVAHSTTLTKTCSVVAVDYQVVCTSGVIRIGSIQRFVSLFAVVLGANLTSFAMIRAAYKEPPKRTHDSLFLAAGAKFMFTDFKWIYNRVYYLDRASAVLNGILTYRRGLVMYAFDIKVWRIFIISLPAKWVVPDDHTLSTPSQYALPLTD
ncbi:hypothetical protein ACHHYP_16011 [Achlya hypogyna]|uniref:Uncharacterized protein n=1 Tax=Achlya hypogyna TaxID=1202772 RepID=A0A1V9ZEF0_ACHHY|nr:hypothetical protein ACHHYP_16011 [Achlya hypogyna]